MKRGVVMTAVTGAIMLVGAFAFAQGPRPGGPGPSGGPPPMRGQMRHERERMMRGPMMREMLTEMLDRALDRASVTPEQRVTVYGARDRAFAALDAQRPDPRGQREQMLALFEAPELTQAQLDAIHQPADQQRMAMRAAIDRAIVEVHDTLTPAQRKIVAEYFRTHGPGGSGFHGRHGPHGGGGPGGPGGPGRGGPAPR